MQTSYAILLTGAMATLGWWYTARRAAIRSRKQHTINTILRAQFNKEFREHVTAISPYLEKGECPDLTDEKKEIDRITFRAVLNHYEFVAVGIRNGDFDEQLFLDAERSTIVRLFTACKEVIYKIRDRRERQSIYEHLEWLNDRWRKPVPLCKRPFEWWLMRPLAGRRHNHHS